MNRTFKTVFLVTSFFAFLFIFGASRSDGAPVMAAESFGQPSHCAAPVGQSVMGIFLSTSNAVLAGQGSRVFEGCWTYFPQGPCRAIYRTGSNYEICGQCDASGNPGSGRCSRIAIQTLNIGYWCS